MPLPALLLPLLAVVTPATDAPINVTGHAWAPFISPMGEPYRAHSAADDTLADWFRQADRNHDGVLTPDEMQADADRFFATLDANHNGEIGPQELVDYEWEIAPDIQVMSRTRPAPGSKAKPRESDDDRGSGHGRWRAGANDEDEPGGLQGAARYGLLNMPEPVAAADTDFNRGITLAEFRQAALVRFQLLDTAHQGRLALAQLEALRPAITAKGAKPKLDRGAPDKRVGNPLPPQNLSSASDPSN